MGNGPSTKYMISINSIDYLASLQSLVDKIKSEIIKR